MSEKLTVNRGNIQYIIDPEFSYYFPNKKPKIQRPVYRWDLTYGLRYLIKDIITLAGTTDLTLLEIGSYAGESTVEFAKIFDKVIAVDPWESGYDSGDGSSHENMNEVCQNYYFLTRNFYNIFTYRMTSDEFYHSVYRKEHGRIDAVYIDGLHTFAGVLKDIQTWYSECGFIAGHDLSIDFPGVEKALKTYSAELKIDFKIRIYPDTSWLIFKAEQEKISR